MGNHKEWRKLAKKARRKAIRQFKAKQRDEEEATAGSHREQSPTYHAWLCEQKQLEEYQLQEEERLNLEQHTRWLKEEELAQERWREMQIKLEEAREERFKQTARIKEEWEREQRKLKELREKKQKEEEEKQRKEENLRIQINNFIENGGDVPEELLTKLETNPLKPTCPFFSKTAACRFKDTCTRNHIRPGISRILLIPNFYSHYSLQQTENEHGSDSLEFETNETYEHFKEFFYDVLPEMEKYGVVLQFKVCCNQEIHLRGNVFVEYSTLRESVTSYQKFQGRWYGGRQLHVEFCSIDSWKSAICGLSARKRCPKGSACNFLHVFANPNNLFANADRDLHRTSPKDFNRTSPRDFNEQFNAEDRQNWRWSESPEPNFNMESSKENGHRKFKRRKDSASFRNRTSRHKDHKQRTPNREKHKKPRRSYSNSRDKQRS